MSAGDISIHRPLPYSTFSLSSDSAGLDHRARLGVTDWISPLIGIGGAVVALTDGGSCSYMITGSGGKTVHQVRSLLGSKGITTWGWMTDPLTGQVMFSVKKKQSKFAESTMKGAGVSYY